MSSLVWGKGPGRVLLDAPLGRMALTMARFGHEVAFRLLAEAAVIVVQEELAREVEFLPHLVVVDAAWVRRMWGDAVVYLTAAGVLTPAEAQVAAQLLGAAPWLGTLEELVATAKGISA